MTLKTNARARRSFHQSLRRSSFVLIGVCALGSAFACGSSSDSGGTKHCTSDEQCGFGRGCDLDDPNDGYCTTLCSEDTDCAVQSACRADELSSEKAECDDKGEHTNQKGICDLYDGKYGPNSCKAELAATGSGGTSSSGGSGASTSTGGTASGTAGTRATTGGTSAGGTSAGGTSAGSGAAGGTRASGGSSPTGGTSSGGEAGSDCPATCADPTPADPLRISGLEAGTGAVDPIGGRNGGWYTAIDAQGSTVYPTAGSGFVPQCGGADNSCFSACFGGTLKGTSYPNAVMGLTFHANNAAYDVSSYTGVTFSVYGFIGANSKLEFKVPTTAVLPVSAGGTCTGTCYDDYNIDLTDLSTTTIDKYVVPFSMLGQDGYGTPAVWNPATARGLEWHVTSKLATVTDEEFVVCVDEVRFSAYTEGGIAN